jgi:ribonucleotide reductase alpha subunit
MTLLNGSTPALLHPASVSHVAHALAAAAAAAAPPSLPAFLVGSVQQLDIPVHMKNKYKTVWEIPMRHVINMARDRAAFICQSQSLNLWLETPTYNLLTSMHFYAWEQGLKTGLYYLRRKPAYHPQQFTIEPCATCSA